MTDKRRWLAVYTKPRWEKKIDRQLSDMGMECYCPLNKVHKKWSDRIKLVEEPLFKSYVFVHVNAAEEKEVRLVTGVLNFVYWLGKPAVIKQIEIERIKRFLNQYYDVSAEPLQLQPNDKVTVIAGALMEKQGRVIRKLGNKVEVEIESLGYKLVAYINKNNLAPLQPLSKK
ncbi:MAG: UpxY family transcription antiterminator [Chitinophagaceae bacterium]